MTDAYSERRVAAAMGGISGGIAVALPRREFGVVVCDLADRFTPINRWGTPEDVGRAVATMAAGDLPFTTDAAIQVDGGRHIHQY